MYLSEEGGGARDACKDGVLACSLCVCTLYTRMHMGSSSFPMASSAVFSLLTCARRSDAQEC
jgi:hypothetical protein